MTSSRVQDQSSHQHVEPRHYQKPKRCGTCHPRLRYATGNIPPCDSS